MPYPISATQEPDWSLKIGLGYQSKPSTDEYYLKGVPQGFTSDASASKRLGAFTLNADGKISETSKEGTVGSDLALKVRSINTTLNISFNVYASENDYPIETPIDAFDGRMTGGSLQPGLDISHTPTYFHEAVTLKSGVHWTGGIFYDSYVNDQSSFRSRPESKVGIVYYFSHNINLEVNASFGFEGRTELPYIPKSISEVAAFTKLSLKDMSYKWIESYGAAVSYEGGSHQTSLTYELERYEDMYESIEDPLYNLSLNYTNLPMNETQLKLGYSRENPYHVTNRFFAEVGIRIPKIPLRAHLGFTCLDGHPMYYMGISYQYTKIGEN